MFYEQASDLEGVKGYIKERLENEDAVIFVVKNNEKYLGFTQLFPTFSTVSMQNTWILNDLFVNLDARKQGIGEMLLHKAKAYAIKSGAKSMSLRTATDNLSAQRLYEKYGYERDLKFYRYDLSLL